MPSEAYPIVGVIIGQVRAVPRMRGDGVPHQVNVRVLKARRPIFPMMCCCMVCRDVRMLKVGDMTCPR